ncbi:MAG: hypothetical protein ACREIU_13410 [Planctomycetota bacterium]
MGWRNQLESSGQGGHDAGEARLGLGRRGTVPGCPAMELNGGSPVAISE